jgi:hypothetical protein
MLPYWLLFSFFAIASIFAREDPRRDKAAGFLWIAWLVLVLMVGLRWQVGPDWFAYQNWWNMAAGRSLERFLEIAGADPGYYALTWIFQRLGLPFWALNLFIGGIFAYGLVQFSRMQVNPWLAIAIAVPYLVIVVAMSGVRQATAIGFVFLALLAYHRQNGWKFLLFIGLAAGFHASAILVLPLAGLSFTRNRFQATVLVLVLLVGAYYQLSSTFVRYSDQYLSRLVVQSSGVLYRLGMGAFPAVIFLAFRNRFKGPAHELILWRNMSIAAIGSLVIFFLVASTTALDRLVLYFFPLQIYVLSWFPWTFRDRAARFIVTLMILAYLGLQLFIFLNFAVNRGPYLPYRMLPFAS